MCWCASSHLHGHPYRALECCPFFDSLFLTLFLSVCFSYPFFFYTNLELNLFLHVAVIGAKKPLALRQLRSLAPWPKTLLSQVMSPTSLTTSTTQRLLKFSSRSPPATRCHSTCVTRNSVTRPSAKRPFDHCSFRSEKNQRAVD